MALAKNLPDQTEPTNNIILAQAIALIVLVVVVILIWVGSQPRLDEYSKNSCLITTGTEDCGGVK